MMKCLRNCLVALVATLVLGACASVPGQFNGLGSDVMTMMVVYRTDDQPLTRGQYETVVAVAKKMGARVGLQLSSSFEAGATGGALGALGGSFDSSGASYGFVGIVGALATYSFAKAFVVAEATEYALRDDENPEFKKIHVSPAFVRSGNTESGPATR